MSKQLITKFYEAFARRDAEGMAGCYADDVVFSDPVFPHLKGEEARDMWRMLCERGADLVVEPSHITDSSAHWDARYTFSATKRPVHNRIDARFVVENGTIKQHTDAFDLWSWSRQALGPVGLLLGWSPLLRNSVRSKAAHALRVYRAKRKAP